MASWKLELEWYMHQRVGPIFLASEIYIVYRAKLKKASILLLLAVHYRQLSYT